MSFTDQSSPERVNFRIPFTPMTLPKEKIELIMACVSSKVIIECSCDDQNINLLTLKNRVENCVRIFADAAGYTTACGYDVEIESAFNPITNQLVIFGVHEDIFDDQQINRDTDNGKPHPDISISIDALAKLSGVNMELSIALSDFREAIRQPSFTSFHCYRAIEALRHTFKGGKESQWIELRTVLNVDKRDIDEIITFASGLRHGEVLPQPWEARKKHMLITWQIIKKYIDWRSINPK